MELMLGGASFIGKVMVEGGIRRLHWVSLEGKRILGEGRLSIESLLSRYDAMMRGYLSIYGALDERH